MRGIGYVEFLSCQEEIEDLLKRGYTISAIHRKLYEDKKITIGVKRFYAILSKKGIKRKPLKQLKISKDIFNKDANKDKNIKSPLQNHLPTTYNQNDESKLTTDQEDEFGIIRKTRDELF